MIKKVRAIQATYVTPFGYQTVFYADMKTFDKAQDEAEHLMFENDEAYHIENPHWVFIDSALVNGYTSQERR